jgi:hypothetical protein
MVQIRDLFVKYKLLGLKVIVESDEPLTNGGKKYTEKQTVMQEHSVDNQYLQYSFTVKPNHFSLHYNFR